MNDDVDDGRNKLEQGKYAAGGCDQAVTAAATTNRRRSTSASYDTIRTEQKILNIVQHELYQNKEQIVCKNMCIFNQEECLWNFGYTHSGLDQISNEGVVPCPRYLRST